MLERLTKGDTIGVFSSSYPITATAPETTKRAIDFLTEKGYKIKKGRLFGKSDFYRSGTIKERADELNELIYDKNVKCIMGAIGGMVTNAVLPYIDFQALKENPKIIIGHSDVTALLLAAYEKTGIRTYYGPNFVSTFAQNREFAEISFQCFEEITSQSLQLPYTYTKPEFYSDELTDWQSELLPKEHLPNKWITVQGGNAMGRLIGGNLNTISGIMGSPYMPQFKAGDILFLEDTEKFASHSERYFSMLKICGVFDKIGGIILGKHRKFDDQGTGKTYSDILLEVLNNENIPILADADCCHTNPMLTLPIGARINLDADNKVIEILSL